MLRVAFFTLLLGIAAETSSALDQPSYSSSTLLVSVSGILRNTYSETFTRQGTDFIASTPSVSRSSEYDIRYSHKQSSLFGLGCAFHSRRFKGHADYYARAGTESSDAHTNVDALTGFAEFGYFKSKAMPYASLGAGWFHIDAINDIQGFDPSSNTTFHSRNQATLNKFGLESRFGFLMVVARHALFGFEINSFVAPSTLRSTGVGIIGGCEW